MDDVEQGGVDLVLQQVHAVLALLEDAVDAGEAGARRGVEKHGRAIVAVEQHLSVSLQGQPHEHPRLQLRHEHILLRVVDVFYLLEEHVLHLCGEIQPELDVFLAVKAPLDFEDRQAERVLIKVAG